MLSSTFLLDSAHMESLTWVFAIFHVTEMSAGLWTMGGFGTGEVHDQIC